MSLYDNTLYIDDIKNVSNLNLPWDKLANTTLLVTGATGLIGSFFVDVILEKNIKDNLNCTVIAVGRNSDTVKTRFIKYANDSHLIVYEHNLQFPINIDCKRPIHYVIHLASNTHPIQYASDPIGTITTNVIGLKHMLDFAVDHQASRFVFASSNEIYGENRGDVEFFDENYCGYINSNSLRAGYPESKRCGESLCQAYYSQQGLDFVIPRFTRTYGPTMKMTDSKAISQFIKKGVNNEDVVLKSSGKQFYSYTYVSDAVSGLLFVILLGATGEAYNIADEHSDIRLIDLARLIADYNCKNIVFENPDSLESAGYSTASKARIDGHKLQALGWVPSYDIKSGLERTISILRALNNG